VHAPRTWTRCSKTLSWINLNILYQKDFVNFAFDLPESLEEQVATANTLSDMDTEITALEARLVKARQLKQGMAQALLNGRIRLVSP